MKAFLVVILTILLPLYESADTACSSAVTCGGCLKADGVCSWCEDEKFTTRSGRCDTMDKLKNSGCQNITTVESDNEIVENKKFSEKVQIRPQRVKVMLRPGRKTSFNISIRPAPNYPVDLYFLMDASKSMKDDLKNLTSLGKTIAREMKNITKNFRLGFGAFVDKKVVPFIQAEFPDFPCNIIGNDGTCRTPFGYEHTLKFSQDGEKFSRVVLEQKISGDLDSPEGGFDALMQATVCEQELGWRRKNESRKIIIYLTDQYPKIAGDGKLAGILTPNDGKCYMEDKGTILKYTAGAQMDYPSIYQLKQKMLDNEIVPIIAVTRAVIELYQGIAGEWRDLGTVVGELSKDSSNIVTLIKNNYKKISSTVRLTDDKPKDFELSYKVDESTCTSGSDNFCSKVALEQEVLFNVNMTALSCPEDPSQPRSEVIRIPGFGEVTVDVEYRCECDCAKQSVANSTKCEGRGTYECGICRCNEGLFGATCQCDSPLDQANSTVSCQSDPNDNTTLCSGFGECVCGQCQCENLEGDRVISGKFCECKNFGCDNYNGRMCGGSERGECVCERCECKQGYVGKNCGDIDCAYNRRTKCTLDGVVCNNHGKCDCDQEICVCDKGYSGKYCKNCISCPEKCNNTVQRDCILCTYFKQEIEENKLTPICDACEKQRTRSVERTVHQCFINLNETCNVFYSLYLAGQEQEEAEVEIPPVCAAPLTDDPNILAIVLGVIGGILLLGILLLLLWKICVTLYDKREFEKYTTGQASSNWEEDDNPIYQRPKQEFTNPVFQGSN